MQVRSLPRELDVIGARWADGPSTVAEVPSRARGDERIRVGQTSAYPALDRAARRLANVYRFTPALRGDHPVTVWVNRAVTFRPAN